MLRIFNPLIMKISAIFSNHTLSSCFQIYIEGIPDPLCAQVDNLVSNCIKNSGCNDLTVCKTVEKKMMMVYSFPEGRKYLARHVDGRLRLETPN